MKLLSETQNPSVYTCVAPVAVPQCSNLPTPGSATFSGNLYTPCSGGLAICMAAYSTPMRNEMSRRCCKSTTPIWVGLDNRYPVAGCSTPQTCTTGGSPTPLLTNVAHGGFTGWSACSATCGVGSQTRSCTAPQRSEYGKPCDSSVTNEVYGAIYTQACNTQSCPRFSSSSSSTAGFGRTRIFKHPSFG